MLVIPNPVARSWRMVVRDLLFKVCPETDGRREKMVKKLD